MIEKDTVRLLLECQRGIGMGVSAIDDCLPSVTSDRMKKIMEGSKREHEEIRLRVEDLLREYHDDKNTDNPLITGMSHAKTMLSLAMNSSDHHIASLMIDGCNMGVKSLSKYLNEYAAASEYSKDVAKKLITVEETLSHDLRDYL